MYVHIINSYPSSEGKEKKHKKHKKKSRHHDKFVSLFSTKISSRIIIKCSEVEAITNGRTM